jgi:hypothetical protein
MRLPRPSSNGLAMTAKKKPLALSLLKGVILSAAKNLSLAATFEILRSPFHRRIPSE